MKKAVLFCVIVCLAMMLQAQVSKTINTTAGNLSQGLTASEKSTVKNITVTGTIDARDFRYLRDSSAFDSINLSTATIVAYTGSKGTLDNNSHIYKENAIPADAFADRWLIKSIKTPTSITAIGDSAFYGCSGLTDTLSIPASVTSIGGGAYTYCSGLVGTLTIPSGVEAIDAVTFYNCSKLSGPLSLPNSVTYLGSHAFGDCTGFTSVVLPNVSYMGDSVFTGCTGLTSARINASIIGTFAFENCSALTSVTLSSSVDSIAMDAFAYTPLLREISVQNKVPLLSRKMGYFVFGAVNDSCILFVPAGSAKEYKVADQWKDLTIIEGNSGLYLPPTVKDTLLIPKSKKLSFPIKAKGAWHVSCDEDWLTISPTSGTGNDSIFVTLSTTKSYSIRTATINITSANIPTLKIVVTQDTAVTAIPIGDNIALLYPNPTTSALQYKMSGKSIVTVFSAEGVDLCSKTIVDEGSIDIEALPAGIYFLRIVFDGNRTITKRFTKL